MQSSDWSLRLELITDVLLIGMLINFCLIFQAEASYLCKNCGQPVTGSAICLNCILVHHFKLIVGYWLLMPPMRAGLKARATGQTN